MATFRAITTACEAVIGVLQQSWQPSIFNGAQLTFQVYRTADFSAPMTAGVSLFLYYITLNSVQRSMPMRPGPDGKLRRPELPLDLHFILTPWAKDASLEHDILGWMMRTIEDNPVIGSGLLNATAAGVFRDDETVEIVRSDLALEEIFRIWDVLPGDIQLSVPYTARVVRLESQLDPPPDSVVLTRDLRYGKKGDR